MLKITMSSIYTATSNSGSRGSAVEIVTSSGYCMRSGLVLANVGVTKSPYESLVASVGEGRSWLVAFSSPWRPVPVTCSTRGFGKPVISLIHCVRVNGMGDVIASAVL